MFDLPPPDPSIEISIASRGYSKGLAQTDGGQLIVRGELGFGALYVAAQGKNLDTNGAHGEALAQIGARGEVAGFELNAAIAYKMLVGLDAPTDGNIVEFTASASRAFGPATPRLAVTFSFDDPGAVRESLYAEAGASVRIAPGTSLSAAIGRRERSGGGDYTAFNAGLSHAFGRHVTAELRYYDTGESALGDLYRGRAVAALRFRF